MAGAGAFVAHAITVLIKRLVRRRRPDHPAIAVNDGFAPSQLATRRHTPPRPQPRLLMSRATGLPLPVVLVPPMALSRILLGSTTPVMWPWVLLWRSHHRGHRGQRRRGPAKGRKR